MSAIASTRRIAADEHVERHPNPSPATLRPSSGIIRLLSEAAAVPWETMNVPSPELLLSTPRTKIVETLETKSTSHRATIASSPIFDCIATSTIAGSVFTVEAKELVVDDKAGINPEVLQTLGLGDLVLCLENPAALKELLLAADEEEARLDHGSFERGTKQAIRLRLAKEEKLYLKDGKRKWKEWVSQTFKCAYETHRRYSIAAEIQIGLARRHCALLDSCAQARALAPFRKRENFWQVIEHAFGPGFPGGDEIKKVLSERFGPNPGNNQLNRILRDLSRIAKNAHPDGDLRIVAALESVKMAIHHLEEPAAR